MVALEYVNRLTRKFQIVVVVVARLKEKTVANFMEYMKALKQAKPYDYQHIMNQILFIETHPYLDSTKHIYEKLLWK